MNYSISIQEDEKRKFSLPTVSKCCCCCYTINLKYAVRIFSIALITWYLILSICHSYLTYEEISFITTTAYLIVVISLIIFLIGTIKNKLFLLKQCQYIYFIYLIFSIYNAIQHIIFVFKKESYDIINSGINELLKGKVLAQDTKENYIKIYQCSYTTIALFMLALYFYFYLVMYSYNQEIKKIIEIQKQQEYSITLARYI
ncbi:hypothetical protein BCR36DRAFT_411436 [Piromyces finnis]|uniref:Transmembrane protein n=1 Tax=Piromyces finnis TaxID=1754191 RepID=A0A1Y1VDA6_9FUNG|nr:hypothetical protein BCR36DRAFT_411436 [Piromyces finnis]|eukprot:ORX52541.1 hypothetical protein BCR36DRAFT_411436 [Piromyces finnis]